MLDTNICIYALSGRYPALGGLFQERAGGLCLSSITVAELEYGIARSGRPAQNRLAVEKFLSGLQVLSFDAEAATVYGEVKSRLFALGTPIGPLDMLIAAHARSLDLTLVTNNRREFDRIPGLRVENWVQPALSSTES